MAMTAPSIVNQTYAAWVNQAHPITRLGTIQTDPSFGDPSIQGGIAQVWYDQVLNQLCIDNLSSLPGMSLPTVVNQAYSAWVTPPHPTTFLGTIQTDPTIDSSIQGGVAQVYYDQVTNTLNVDNISS